MTKAIVKKQGAELARNEQIPEELLGAWGSEGVDNSDILIPRLLLMQSISELVGNGEAAAGNIIKSTTKEVLSNGKDKTCEFIPIMTFKTWRIMVLKGGKYEFKTIEPMTAENVNEPYEWVGEDNQQFRRDRTINFYVLLPSEIKKEIEALKGLSAGDLPDPDDCLVPCLLSFTRTSMGAGKELATHFKKAQHFKIPPAVTTFTLLSEFEKNDKGNYHVAKVVKSRKTTPEELAMCKRWYDTLQTVTVKIDDDLVAEDLAEPVMEDAGEMNENF